MTAHDWALIATSWLVTLAVLVGLELADRGHGRTFWLSRVIDDWARGLEAGVRLIFELLERGIRRMIPRRWQA